MPRRSATMLAATLLLIGLLCASVLMRVPYTEMSPGPTYNTLGEQEKKSGGSVPVIAISGHETYPTSGHLNMTTVQVTGAKYEPSLVSAVIGWLRKDVLVVPHDNVYPKGQTDKEAQQENAEQFASSEDSAKTAALKQLGIPVGTQIVVSSVVAGGPSEGKLHAGDRIVAVDGTAVTAKDQVAALVTKHKPGETVEFTVVPHTVTSGSGGTNGTGSTAAEKKVAVTTAKATDGRAIVGILPGTDHTYPFTIDIGLQDVGGPSAGLMFSLGIVDKLTPGDLTGGKFVAGTGTISDNGEVGPIGGIQMKLIAARDKGAEYFMTPAENCSEAVKGTPGGLTLVKVESLNGALKAMDQIRAGRAADLPSCPK
nr:PDZ domain-containing protein [Streptomyces sp. TLI_235]